MSADSGDEAQPPRGALSGGARSEASSSDSEDSRAPIDSVADGTVEGERDLPSVNKERSLQARANNLLALAVAFVVGGGFLFWWFSSHWKAQRDAETKVREERAAKASGDVRLPPLGVIDAPRAPAAEVTAPAGVPARMQGMDAPVLPAGIATGVAAPAYAGPPQPTPEELALQRKLSPSVLYRPSLQGAAVVGGMPVVRATAASQEAGASASGIGGYLTPTATLAVSAQVVAARRFVIPKGHFVDCTLETAISSQLPGLTTCITAFDIFGADGKVVLIERGSKLVGETKGEVRQGMNRIFVLWTEARTPTGVVVPLASPGTDALGRSGVQGTVDTHFWQRFGAAILISVIDGVVQAAVAAQRQGNSTVILNPQGSREVMTEVLRNTVAIAPTVSLHQGERVQVLVARDVDFRAVYELRASDAPN